MFLRELFKVSGGSVPGSEHTKPGLPGWRNNQDAFVYRISDNFIVGVIADGCGSSRYSEVGAEIGARIATKILAQEFQNRKLIPKNIRTNLLRLLKEELVWNIAGIAKTIQVDSQEDTIEEGFLFTLIGFMIDPMDATIFSMGDGVFAVNGEIEIIPSFPGNAPPYIANLARERRLDRPTSDFVIRAEIETKNLQSLLIGSDGLSHFIDSIDLLLPGKTEHVGELSDFWTKEKYVQNPDAIRRRLSLVGLETIDHSGVSRIKSGLLPDDTTAVVLQRIKKGGGYA